MSSFMRFVGIIARRDFKAIVLTPMFLFFLLSPLLTVAIGFMSGSGAESVARNASKLEKIAIVSSVPDQAELKAASSALRSISSRMPELEFVKSGADDAKTVNGLFGRVDKDYSAVMYGPLTRPIIWHAQGAERSAQFLAEIAERTLRGRAMKLASNEMISKAEIKPIKQTRSGVTSKRLTGQGAVFIIFILTILIASQAVGMLAEEKSNKVIEIIASAAPLEAVFLGKLVGMFGVSVLFVTFWGAIISSALILTPGGIEKAALLAPAVGMVPFIALLGVYFTMSYMLLSAVLLGLGGLASSQREIQMMSLPVTLLQVGMFSLSNRAAGDPGSSTALMAEWIPFSSPMAMAAKAANESALWPHAVALVWQALWVAIIIWLSARLFRFGVLKSGGWKAIFKRG